MQKDLIGRKGHLVRLQIAREISHTVQMFLFSLDQNALFSYGQRRTDRHFIHLILATIHKGLDISSCFCALAYNGILLRRRRLSECVTLSSFRFNLPQPVRFVLKACYAHSLHFLLFFFSNVSQEETKWPNYQPRAYTPLSIITLSAS